MWPFRRRAAREHDRSPRDDWRGLPALARSTDDIALTSAPAAFRASLPTLASPALADEQLCHIVSTEAPSGVAIGLATVVNGGRAVRSGEDLLLRSNKVKQARPQRSLITQEPAEPLHEEPGPAPASATALDDAAPPEATSAPPVPVRGVAMANFVRAQPPTLVLRLPVDPVAGPRAPNPPDETPPPSEAASSVTVQGPIVEEVTPLTTAPPEEPPLEEPAPRRLGLGAPLPPAAPWQPIQRRSEKLASTVTGPDASHTAPERRGEERARAILRSESPTGRRPPESAASTQQEIVELPLAIPEGAAPPPEQGRSSDEPPRPEGSEEKPIVGLGVTPVVGHAPPELSESVDNDDLRRFSLAGTDAEFVANETRRDHGFEGLWSYGTPAPPLTGTRDRVAPLIGNRSTAIVDTPHGGAPGPQRGSEVPADLREHVERATGVPLPGVVVHRGPETSTLARQLRARAFTMDGEVHLPAGHGPVESAPARRLMVHELVHVAQQRELGSSRPAEHTAAGQRLEREAIAIEQEIGGGVFPAAPPPSPELGQHAHRAPDGSVEFAPEPEPEASAAAQRASGSAAVTTPATVPRTTAEGDSPQDLDALARRLYDRLRPRLYSDLKTQRERAGLIAGLPT